MVCWYIADSFLALSLESIGECLNHKRILRLHIIMCLWHGAFLSIFLLFINYLGCIGTLEAAIALMLQMFFNIGSTFF